MKHPIPVGTAVLAAYQSCETCGPSHIEKNNTRIQSWREEDGTYIYTLMDGREINESGILEVR